MAAALEISTCIVLLSILSVSLAHSSIGNWEHCGARLERALDTIHRDSSRRNRLEEEEVNVFYQQELRSARLEMSVSRIAVKLPQGIRDTSNSWVKVEKCIYEPSNNSLQTRVMLHDLSVSGIVSLTPHDYRPSISAESCRMTLRLRQAGLDFLTSPIARGREQMRIRTESSFLEPRFTSIYAYGCHLTRLDKQIKRQDKWSPFYPPRDESSIVPLTQTEEYEAAEPRQLVDVSKEVDVVIPNETRQSRFVNLPIAKLGIWRKNVWLTKPLAREKRAPLESATIIGSTNVLDPTESFENGQESSSRSIRASRDMEMITPQDFASALSGMWTKVSGVGNCTEQSTQSNVDNITNIILTNMNDSKLKTSFKRENNYQIPQESVQKETKHLYIDETTANIYPINLENDNRNWQSKEYIAREMEDVFLRGASQALTRYIERRLHPAIKETLMVSMGYTISYG